ncbi:MAG TPA: hypothetical protein VIJ38_07275 [Acidobacteriaceae bacterium]
MAPFIDGVEDQYGVHQSDDQSTAQGHSKCELDEGDLKYTT